MSATLAAAVLLLIVGFLLVIAEVLFPSFGLLSVIAALAFIGSAWLAFKTGWAVGTTFVVISVATVPVLVYVGFKYILPNTPIGRQIILGQVVSEEGEASGTDRDLRRLVGAEGVTHSYLRPAGVAEIAGERVDVVTEGGMVDRGTRVRVIGVEGNRVVVRPVDGLVSTDEQEGQA